MSFLMPESDWKPTPVSLLPSWEGAKRIAIDCETKDSDLRILGPGTRRDAYTTGWSFAIEGGPKHYLPIRHEGGGNLPVGEVLGYLQHQVKNFRGEFIGANLSYDYDFGCNDGFEWNQNARMRDVQIADPLINELHMSYSLKSVGLRWGVEAKDESLLVKAAQAQGLDPKAGMWRLHSRYVGAYAEQDVASPLLIYEKQRSVLDRDDLWRIFNLESDVLPVLVKMRQRGVLIDQDKLSQVELWAENEERAALQKIHHLTGVRIDFGNVWKPDALAPALEAIGLRLEKTSTGQPQIDRFLLGGTDHEVAKAILRARKVNKIRTTFAASMWRYMVNGRIHCTFHQIAKEDDSGDQKGVRYGRLSAVDPNLQQQPSPDRDPDIAGEWRKIFIADPGKIWGCADYSQQEPRWTTHFASVLDLPKAREAARRYREDPTTDNHEMMTRLIHTDEVVDMWLKNEKGLFKVNRGYSKNIFLGVCYGEGGPKLCNDIGKPTRWCHIVGWGARRKTEFFENKHEAMAYRMKINTGYIREVAGIEGQEILDNFDEEVPYVRKLADKAKEQANSYGYVKTIFGRRLHFEQREDMSYDFVHKALNRVIQGNSADQMKYALVQIERAGHFLQLQVHDETNGSYENTQEAKEVGRIMKDSVLDYCEPHLPFNVDVECGPSWGELKGV